MAEYSLGSRIKRMRMLSGMTQAELSRAARITQATISRLEAEMMHELKMEALVRLAKALSVSTDYLTGKSAERNWRNRDAQDERAKELFSLFEKMNAEDIDQLLQYARFIVEKDKVLAG